MNFIKTLLNTVKVELQALTDLFINSFTSNLNFDMFKNYKDSENLITYLKFSIATYNAPILFFFYCLY